MPPRRRKRDRIIETTDRFIDSLKAVLPGRTPVPSRSSSPNPSINWALRPSIPTASIPSARIPAKPQPPIEPDSSPVYQKPEIVTDPDHDGDSSTGRITELAAVGFQGLKTTLQVLERASGVFPPLKSVIGGILGVIEVVEVRNFKDVLPLARCPEHLRSQMTYQNHQDYKDLEQKLATVVSIIKSHSDRSTTSPAFDNRLKSFSA
jgi:hypothetical protein